MNKELLGEILAGRVADGQTIGLGSGSTAEVVLKAIGERIKREKLTVFGAPTSIRTAVLADAAGISVLSPLSTRPLSWAFDGADEIDDSFNMIKGRGAAMLREKLIAQRAEGKLLIVVTKEKIVKNLGERFAIPIATLPEAIHHVSSELRKLGAQEVVPRESAGKYGPAISDDGHVVLDARFAKILPELEKQMKAITGVVETGLFVGLAREVLVLKEDGVWTRKITAEGIKEELLKK